MVDIKLKKSVVLCAFSTSVNSTFCGGVFALWSGNASLKESKGEKEKFFDTIIASDKCIFRDSEESLITKDVNSSNINDILSKTIVERLANGNGVLTEMKYEDKYYYFFSEKNLQVSDFFEAPLKQDKDRFIEIRKKFFKKSIIVNVEKGKVSVSNGVHINNNANKENNPNGGSQNKSNLRKEANAQNKQLKKSDYSQSGPRGGNNGMNGASEEDADLPNNYEKEMDEKSGPSAKAGINNTEKNAANPSSKCFKTSSKTERNASAEGFEKRTMPGKYAGKNTASAKDPFESSEASSKNGKYASKDLG